MPERHGKREKLAQAAAESVSPEKEDFQVSVDSAVGVRGETERAEARTWTNTRAERMIGP